MPSASVKNPNGPSKNRLAARAAKTKERARKSSAAGKTKISKVDQMRGARAGLLPTSGKNAPTSAKKRRKLEKKMGYVLKRKMEAEGEVKMKDVQDANPTINAKEASGEETMDMDTENIS